MEIPWDRRDGVTLRSAEARVVVAVDFGTTFSGFAYAHRDNPAEIHKLYEWDGAGEANAVAYCKTQTSLYYTKDSAGRWQLKEWGWPAFVSFKHDLRIQDKAAKLLRLRTLEQDPIAAQPEGCFLTKFKLHLAGESNVANSAGGLSAEVLPEGLSVATAITDYLAKISTYIVKQLQTRYGPQLTATEIQWCLTVPAIWDDSAKQMMKVYAERAGMVQGRHTPRGVTASPHQLIICLEPEAASLYCLENCKDIELQKGDHYLTADIGGGTVDIVVHEKVSDIGEALQCKEVAASYGGLCGGTYADQNFINFLKQKVGCYEDNVADRASLELEMQKNWELRKRSYTGKPDSAFAFSFAAGLANAWEKHDSDLGLEQRESYDELELNNDDMKQILDPVVDEIIKLIKQGVTDKVKTIMVVGGFSASPYLMNRIMEAFSGQLMKVINPPDPGAAICHGAVLMAVAPGHSILCRISRKTYGVNTVRRFTRGDPVEKKYNDGEGEMCRDVFSVYVYSGVELAVDEKVYGTFQPSKSDRRIISIEVYSGSGSTDPDFITDEGVVMEGSYDMGISDGLEQGKNRKIEVSMFFGKSVIEIQGRRQNFGDTEKIDKFWVNILDV